jgi:phage I-like protein
MGLLVGAATEPLADVGESDLARRLRAGGFLAFTRSSRITLKDGERETWIQVSKLGEWKGHAAGEFSLEAEHHDSAVSQFGRTANDLVLDYEHQSVSFLPVEAPAAGWISELRVEDDGALMARVKFTDKAAQYIRSDEYRYTSPVWLFDVPDRENGSPILAELHSVALTNVPFLDGMQPVALSRLTKKEMIMSTTKTRKNATPAGEQALAELQTLLGLGSEEELAAWVSQNSGALESMASGEGGGEAEMVRAELTRARRDLETKTAALSIAIDEKTSLAAEVSALRESEARRLVDEAIKEGRASAGQLDALLTLARHPAKKSADAPDGPRELFFALTASRIATPITDQVTRQTGGGGADADEPLSGRALAFYRSLKQSKPRRGGKALSDQEIRALAREKAALA